MDLTRVYVNPPLTDSILVPGAWSAWTWEGIAFRRREGQVWQEVDPGIWMLPETGPYRVYLRFHE